MSTSTSGWRGLKQAQRAFNLTSCQECGTKDNLHRHHKDRDRLNNTPENIAILCHPCHAKEHAKQGDWGRGNVPHRPCQICGQVFQSNRTRRGRVCSNACMVEMGKRSAAKRWAGRTKERQCTNCQKTFTYTRPRQTTCSRSCGNIQAHRNRGGAQSQ